MENKSRIGKIGIGFFIASIVISVAAIIFASSKSLQDVIRFDISSMIVKKGIITVLYLFPAIFCIAGFILMIVGGVFKNSAKPVRIILITLLIVEFIVAMVFGGVFFYVISEI